MTAREGPCHWSRRTRFGATASNASNASTASHHAARALHRGHGRGCAPERRGRREAAAGLPDAGAARTFGMTASLCESAECVSALGRKAADRDIPITIIYTCRPARGRTRPPTRTKLIQEFIMRACFVAVAHALLETATLSQELTCPPLSRGTARK